MDDGRWTMDERPVSLSSIVQRGNLMRRISLVVPSISCEQCKETIEAALKDIEGVKEAIVDIPKQRVALTYDPDRVPLSTLEEALSEVGYDVTDTRQ
jgi:copper chaperone